jgi:transcriptional regulatory protein GAL4
VEEATIYTYLRTQANFHLRNMQIYNCLISNPSPPVEKLISLDDELIGGWLGDLPQYFRDDDLLMLNPDFALAHSIGRWRYRNLRIIMYRQFVIRWADQTDSSQEQEFSKAEELATERCFKAAKETIFSIKFFWTYQNQTRLAAWYVL